MRALVEEGLRRVLDEPTPGVYELPDRSVGGRGLRPPFRDTRFVDILAVSYGDRYGQSPEPT